MSACPHHKETLMLDIFGELNPNLKTAWKQHLSSCPDCMAEKEAVSQALDIAKTTLEPPSLGEIEAAAMRERVVHDLTIDPGKNRKRIQSFFFSRGFIPILASACVLLFALGLITSKFLTGPGKNESVHLAAVQEQPPAEDVDIINNLDLLSNLEALDKLARVIDQSKPPSHHNNVQGTNGHGEKSIFS